MFTSKTPGNQAKCLACPRDPGHADLVFTFGQSNPGITLASGCNACAACESAFVCKAKNCFPNSPQLLIKCVGEFLEEAHAHEGKVQSISQDTDKGMASARTIIHFILRELRKARLKGCEAVR